MGSQCAGEHMGVGATLRQVCRCFLLLSFKAVEALRSEIGLSWYFPLLFHIHNINCVGCYFSNSCDNVFFVFVENATTLVIKWSFLLVLAAWVRVESDQWETKVWLFRVLYRNERGTTIKTIHSIIDNYLHKIMCLLSEFKVWKIAQFILHKSKNRFHSCHLELKVCECVCISKLNR